jgi:RHS repeat-associated protein
LPSTSGWHSIWGKRPTDSRARQGKQFSSNAKSALRIFIGHNEAEHRTSKTVAGDTTDYVVDLAATLPVVISDTQAVYLYGLDIIAQQQSGRLYYVHDGLGSVRQLVDTTGQIETNYAYDPFGVPQVGGDVYNPYQFTGEAWDAEVGLLYLRARYYQPEVGRFITKDPWAGDVWRPGTLNRYVYATNNAVNLVDPTGLNGEEPLGLVWDPPVVKWIHEQMIANAQGGVVPWLSVLNEAMVPGMDPVPVQAKMNAYAIFGWMVRPGGQWDPKDYIRKNYYAWTSHKIADYWYYYDAWGNIMFGYLGTAAGFSEFELLNGAGLVQVPTDIINTITRRDLGCLPIARPWYNSHIPWAWDHPEDRVTSKIGIRLWKTFNINVQMHHIIEAVVEAGEKGEIERRQGPW